MTKKKQFLQSLAALGPLLLTVVVGMTLGYSAVLLPQLQNHTATPHPIQINQEEASWVGKFSVQSQLAIPPSLPNFF